MNEIVVGRVFQTTHADRPRMRWVLGVQGGVVCYSRGGNAHYFCKLNSFKRWMQRTHAEWVSNV